ncbi:MAG: ABC transporter permease subunit [Rubrivivax sp.]|nr:ABC transporter permease subunit [Pyrinomonadaceae bacterium]
MFSRIIRHDLRQLVADRTLALVALLFAFLLAYALWNGAAWARTQARAVSEAEQTARAGLEVQRRQVIDVQAGRRNAADFFGLGAPSGINFHAALPPAPLAPLSLGVSELLPHTATVNFFSTKDELVKQGELDNPTNLLSGRFDPAFLFVYLYPLLVLALSYNLLSQEKEQGTLALTLAQPVSLAKLVAGKTLARAGVLLALAAVITFAGLLAGGANASVEGVLTRFLLWFACVAAYTCFWFALAILAGAFGRSSATNAAALAAVWLALVVIYPALLNVAATSLYPLPSRLQFINDLRDAENETSREATNLLAKYMTDHPELAGGDVQANVRDFQMRFFVQKQELERQALARTTAYDEQLARQQTAINRFGFLSPAIALQDAFNDLAGTSRRRHQLFAAQVRDFIDTIRGFYAPLAFRKQTLQPDDYDRTPTFQLRDETTADVARRAGGKLVVLTALALLAAALAALRLRRYPIAG